MNSFENPWGDETSDAGDALPEENAAGLVSTYKEPAGGDKPAKKPKRYHRSGHRRRHRRSFGNRFVEFMDSTVYMLGDLLAAVGRGFLFVGENVFKPFVLFGWLGTVLSVIITVLCENGTIPNRLGPNTAYAFGSLVATAAYVCWLSCIVINNWEMPFRYYAKAYLPFGAVYCLLPVLFCFLPGRGGMMYGEPVFTYLFLPFKTFHFAYQELYARGIVNIEVAPLWTRLGSSALSGLFLLLVFVLTARICHVVREKRSCG